MRSPKWTVVLKTTPMDAQAAREQARWLKLADDVLLNRTEEPDSGDRIVLAPGSRAASQLKEIARKLKRTVGKYRTPA